MTMPAQIIRLATSAAPEADADSRTVTFTLSDGGVARDGHTLATAGWDISAYMRNPVFLWAHDADSVECVIGRMLRIYVRGDRLMGDVEFAPADINPMAETCLRMVRAGYLNAVSVGFLPRKGKPASGRGAGAYDFSEQELLEVSLVPVPSLPTALAEIRRSGINTAPLMDWVRRIMETGTMTEPAPTLPAVPAQRAPRPLRRDLYDVSRLAYLLMELAWLEECVEWETEQEGDGSDIPMRLAEAMKGLGQILVDMTIEEVAELIGAEEAEAAAAGTRAERLSAGLKRALVAFVRCAGGGTPPALGADAVAAMEPAGIAAALRGDLLSLSGRRALADLIEVRAGRVLSTANEQCLRTAHGYITQAAETIMGIVAQNATDEAPATTELQEVDDSGQRAATERRQRELIAAQAFADTLTD